MKRLLPLLLTGAIALFSFPSFLSSNVRVSKLAESVRPLQVDSAELSEYLLLKTGRRVKLEEGLINLCSTSYINKNKHYWLTAAHCLEANLTYYIDGQKTSLVLIDVQNDIAILSTPISSVVRPLKLAKNAPQVCTNGPSDGPNNECKVSMAGYPFGLQGENGEPFYVNGVVVQTVAHLSKDKAYMLYSIVGAPGNSGSAVVNYKGEVVSVLQIGFGSTFGSLEGGSTYEALAQYEWYFGN